MSDKTRISPIKSAVAIHDLSGFGRCALTCVIPTLSVMGIQCVPCPTALLSTHTGGFEGFSFLELTDEMEKFARHWSSLGLTFDAVYSGFLGSARQIDVVKNIIKRFAKEETIVLVDPVLGDDGKKYSTITDEIVEKMRGLALTADVITPNITEAYFLIEEEYGGLPIGEKELSRIMLALDKKGYKSIVITGIRLDSAPGEVVTSVLCDDGIKNIAYERIKRFYPGTGDIFASVLLGRLMKGDPLYNAAAYSSRFVHEVIEDSAQYDLAGRDGVLLEKNLNRLIQEDTI